MRAFTIVFACAASVVLVPAARAQERVVLSAAVGGVFGADGPSAALNISGGRQVSSNMGVELEVAYFPDQTFQTSDDFMPQLFPSVPPTSLASPGRTVAVLGSFVASLPRDRVRPYAQLGAGIANVRHRVPGSASPGGGLDAPVAQIGFSTVSATSPALSLGVGVEIRVWRHLAVGADARYMRLLEAVDRLDVENLTRFGARLSYWF